MFIYRLLKDIRHSVEVGPCICSRYYHHVRPVIKHNVTKPEVDVTKYDPEGSFSPAVVEFIKARDFENGGGNRKANVVSLISGETKGVVTLNDFVFGANPRIDILHRNMVWYRACIRAGTANTKRRSEVRGGGRKPWQQKGLGKARQGSIRAPHWRKGGSVKGPKPRDWSFELPFKVRRMGLRTALSCKLAQGDLTIIEDYSELTEANLRQTLIEMNLNSCLLVDGFKNDVLNRLIDPLEKVDFSHIMTLHVNAMLIRPKLVLSLQAVRLLEEKLCEDNRIVTDPNYALHHEGMLLPKDLLFKEYDPKHNEFRGRLIPKLPKKCIRHTLPLTRRDRK